MMPDVDRFEAVVTRLEGTLLDHRREMNKVEGDIHRLRLFLLGVAVFTLVAIAATVATIKLNLDTRDSARRRAADQTEARVSACVQTNAYTQAVREALVQSILALADDPTHLTPEQQAIADRYRDRAEQALPYRDCSPGGINAYFEDPPQDPAIKEGTG